MVPGLFNDPTDRTVLKALKGLTMRQQAIGNNIANIDTPHYKAQAVNFEDALRAEVHSQSKVDPKMVRIGMMTTNDRHIPLEPMVETFVSTPHIEQTLNGTLRNDDNTVDVDREMAMLAETQITFAALSQVAGGKLTTIRNAINEGRR